MSDDKKVETPESNDAVEETAVVEETPVQAEEPKTAHDDFDWSISNKNAISYTDDEIENYLKDYEQTLTLVNENEIIKGKVTSISASDVVLDINYKSDGIVSLSEFRDLGEIKIGDEVDVYVESQEDERGQLVLSRRKAKLFKAWENIVDSYKNGTIITGTVISKTKGGLIADCGGLETFLPGSQIDIKPIIDYDQYVGKTMEFKVVKINEAIKNAVISHKALIESDLADQREAIIQSLEKGQVLEGIVKNITDFGAFMDLGGVDGLLYITDISWGRINHPNEVLELNQKLNVVVLDFDENKKRISLGLKQLQPHPWEVLGAEIVEGSVLKGKIVNIEDYGAFLEISPGVEGLIHVSEVSWRTQPVNAREFFTLDQEFDAKVVTIDREERKMSLSIKQLSEDPWDGIEAKFPVESRHTGIVKNLTPYGVFVELEEGIGGMVHISDLSWTKRYSHPSEFTKVGEEIECVILEIDKSDRKLSLGHKQIEENPWDTFAQVFPQGSYHEATVVKKEDRGSIVQLPYGLEAFAPAKHLKKEDGTFAAVDDNLTFKVIEFNRDDKRILVSHTRYLEDIQREADDQVKGEQRKEREDTRNVVKTRNASIEKTTLGDLNVFSQLKEQMAESKPAPKAAPKKEEVKEEVAPVKEEAKEAAPKAEKSETAADDLKKIEGIGPKIAEKLGEAGINTFAELAAASAEKLGEILEEAGPRYKMHDPTTWPQQSQLAADGKWDELKTLQDELDGGRK
ncbi:30S ribosomal protein S1 [Portibacter lacus]|uniref:Small ribosomal subunit protein bS1 n=1 Tax=Portibacter lacus TaxID=1099794 RepID=A0AA37STC4_9BACT|nr:30S ribosomal protein S1 [Portibacter lacus]GLR17690.1 30S ribosomal protein S1 [Portibacter lacus]